MFRLFTLGQKSSSLKPENIGLEQGHLKVCGSKPNCVSSSAKPDTDFYIEPLISENIEGLWDDLNMALQEMGFEIVTSQDNYLHVTATTKLIGFVDDVEFNMIPEQGTIEMKSQSRVGYSDLGANRKRLEKIRQRLVPSKN